MATSGANTDQTVISGVFGTSQWNLDDSGVLHFGAGEFVDTANKSVPWSDYSAGIKEISFDNQVIGASDSSWLFSNLYDLSNVNNADLFDTSKVTNMAYMFFQDAGLNYLDLSSWDTGNVTNMTGMFAVTSNLIDLDIANWDTANVADMAMMFYQSGIAQFDAINWNVSNVTNMSGMFQDSKLKEFNAPDWDTSKVTDMTGMFATSRYSSGMPGWDGTTQAQSTLEKVNVSNWNTSNVKRMVGMFQNSRLTNIDISGWNMSGISTNYGEAGIDAMFSGNSLLKEITLGKNVKLWYFDYDQGITSGLAQIPDAPNNGSYTGYWQSVGTGTVDRPAGSIVLTAHDLMKQYDGKTMADTYVWQPKAIAAGVVSVELVDQDGNVIEHGKVTYPEGFYAGARYEISYPEKLEGYKLISSPRDVTYILTKEPQSYTYVYEKIESTPEVPTEATVTYIDDTTGKIINKVGLSGLAGANDNYRTAQSISQYESAGYKLVSDNYPAAGIVYIEGQDNQQFTVHLAHKITTTVESKDIINTTKYAYNSGAVASPETTVPVTAEQTITVDAVTGAIVRSGWIIDSQALYIPKIAGYTSNINIGEVTDSTQNIVTIVTYTKNKGTEPTRPDNGDGEVINPSDTTEPTNPGNGDGEVTNPSDMTEPANSGNSNGEATTPEDITTNQMESDSRDTTIQLVASTQDAGNVDLSTDGLRNISVVNTKDVTKVNRVSDKLAATGNTFPQTGESNNSLLVTIGVAILSLIAPLMFWQKKKNRKVIK